MDLPTPVAPVARLIQLAIAPVFLLAGIGAILNVLAQRLARVVDRSRELEREREESGEEERPRIDAELVLLDRRMGAANLALSACTLSALFVCLLVAFLFVADLADFAFGRAVALLFVATMALVTVGLLVFLYEIRLSMRARRLRRKRPVGARG